MPAITREDDVTTSVEWFQSLTSLVTEDMMGHDGEKKMEKKHDGAYTVYKFMHGVHWLTLFLDEPLLRMVFLFPWAWL